MGNLALTYSDLGRHADALAMEEKVLAFRRRVLPEDHPSIGEGHVWSGVGCELRSLCDEWSGLVFYNISFSLERSGALPRAMECAREALRIWQASCPPGHEDITDAEERVRKLELATR